jgi:hypothetical protein
MIGETALDPATDDSIGSTSPQAPTPVGPKAGDAAEGDRGPRWSRAHPLRRLGEKRALHRLLTSIATRVTQHHRY